MQVLGGGAQGSACTFDDARYVDVERVVLADLDMSRPLPFLKPYLGSRVVLRALDTRDRLLTGGDRAHAGGRTDPGEGGPYARRGGPTRPLHRRARCPGNQDRTNGFLDGAGHAITAALPARLGN